jgi:hypothetical protein
VLRNEVTSSCSTNDTAREGSGGGGDGGDLWLGDDGFHVLWGESWLVRVIDWIECTVDKACSATHHSTGSELKMATGDLGDGDGSHEVQMKPQKKKRLKTLRHVSGSEDN